ncbi:hypothetical protein [Hymenobacter wooponensis]|uniref:Thiaminase-2/PQQC domain-containing protein n=1 Tax=Hymenobacter wooponensis TaxID=1525360 RepID=A0A4Z0MG89_9BACT|nr:hypothetical protein [Hymenobacter wooponensis]TGD78235.1 hypothetical protein EU557_19170 [Hymenobacter wooponensis]
MEYLRKSVVVHEKLETIYLDYAFWQFQVPKRKLDTVEGMNDFVAKRYLASIVDINDTEVANLLNLFKEIGMFAHKRKEIYKLYEVLEVFEIMSTIWHALYYSHPIWDKLRNGELSESGFIAWVLHNYHLSRSAGVTASRCAAFSSRPDVRKVFLESALEEYPHCEYYYMINDKRLGITSDDVKNYVPLPSSIAIDQQMLRLAEDDWLAHIMVAYFQESTASYYKQCCDFYNQVETSYNLPGFFESWKGHIQLDIGYGHASAFTDILKSQEPISGKKVESSLKNAALAVQFIVDALDDILKLNMATDNLILRKPVSILSENAYDNFNDGISATEVLSKLKSKDIFTGFIFDKTRKISCEEVECIKIEIAFAMCRALSYSKRHDEILYIGKLLEANRPLIELRNNLDVVVPITNWAAGVSNFLRELALIPSHFVIGLSLVCLNLKEMGFNYKEIEGGNDYNSISYLMNFYKFSESEASLIVNEMVQLQELWFKNISTKIIEVDVFID